MTSKFGISLVRLEEMAMSFRVVRLGLTKEEEREREEKRRMNTMEEENMARNRARVSSQMTFLVTNAAELHGTSRKVVGKLAKIWRRECSEDDVSAPNEGAFKVPALVNMILSCLSLIRRVALPPP